MTAAEARGLVVRHGIAPDAIHRAGLGPPATAMAALQAPDAAVLLPASDALPTRARAAP